MGMGTWQEDSDAVFSPKRKVGWKIDYDDPKWEEHEALFRKLYPDAVDASYEEFGDNNGKHYSEQITTEDDNGNETTYERREFTILTEIETEVCDHCGETVPAALCRIIEDGTKDVKCKNCFGDEPFPVKKYKVKILTYSTSGETNELEVSATSEIEAEEIAEEWYNNGADADSITDSRILFKTSSSFDAEDGNQEITVREISPETMNSLPKKGTK